MKLLAVIPARGGSKGIPGKNIKLLNGKPLIYYTIEAARSVFPDEDICVSTDSLEIKQVVEKTRLHVPFMRPAKFSSDTSGSYEVLIHALEYYKKLDKIYDAIILLQPTSPLRTRLHISEALTLFSPDIDMVVSVKETKSNPYYVLFEEDKSGFLSKSKKGHFVRRQDCPKVYEINGAIYVINTQSLESKRLDEFSKIVKYKMSEYHSIDIDSPFDWELCETIIRSKINER